MDHISKSLKQKAERVLFGNIVPFWINHSIDEKNGGFYGRISNELSVEHEAPKSLILNVRILWTFSALYNYDPKAEYLKMANRAYDYLSKHFMDKKYGGAYWLVNFKGKVLNDKKKIYGQAFTVYALSEYYRVTQRKAVLDEAITLFRMIEKHNYDNENFGYFETSNRNWTIAEEMRLSEVDMNEVKSMNTHLHLMEAYTTLYKVWKDKEVGCKLESLINNFLDFVIDPNTLHFKLFFNEFWNVRTNRVSFGHDIEGSWLLYEAAEILGNKGMLEKISKIVLNMVDVTIREGFNTKFSIYTERYSDGSLLTNCHWWQQAEAVVGLVNAYQISGRKEYLECAVKAWDFIEDHFVDKENGEWFYEIKENGTPNQKLQKVSEWKGPYHNGRACLEIIKRLK